jgi:hypothetical protein
VTKPKPIGPDPARDGRHQFVVSFRLKGTLRQPTFAAEALREALQAWAASYSDGLAGLSVATRVIGAQGEQSQMEGEGPPQHAAADTPAGSGAAKGAG